MRVNAAVVAGLVASTTSACVGHAKRDETVTRCATEAPPAELLQAAEQMNVQEKAMREAGVMKTQAALTVDTWFHVVAASESVEDGYITDQMLQDQLDVMNENYAPHGIQFNLSGTTRTVNANWADYGSTSAMKRSLRKGDYKTLNLYFQRTLTLNALGVCTLPTAVTEGSTSFYNDGCSINAQTVPGGSADGFNLGKTATHEIGHWFGLYHTFQNGCSGSGDYVDDTPAHNDSSSGCPVGQDSCPNQPGLDPIHNYMSYSDDACYEEFTPGQEARMYSMWDAYRA